RFLTVGRTDRAYRRYAIVVSGIANRTTALGDFVVGGSERAPVRLGDVAVIREAHADPRLEVVSPRGPAAGGDVARRAGGGRGALAATWCRSTPASRPGSSGCGRRCQLECC